jgi:O-glycosyl hydrolase
MKRRQFLFAAAAVTSGLPGCGGDNAPSASAPGPSPVPPPPAPGPSPGPAPAPTPTPTPTPAPAANFVVNGATRHQLIDGFGASANSLPYLSTQGAAAIDTLIDSGGITHWRVIVESTRGWETSNDNSDPAAFNWSYYTALYETQKFQALWALLAKLMSRNAPLIMLNVMGDVPSFMGGTSISAEDEWVEMIASLMYFARVTKGLRIDALAPLNETDLGSGEGPVVNSTQYVRLIKKLWTRLDALGIGDVRLVGPDTAYVASAVADYLPAMMADSSLMARLQRFALHNYDGSTGAAPGLIQGSNYSDRGFWMTEFSARCSGCDTGTQPTNDWQFARGTFEFALNHLRDGAAAVFVYDAFDSFYEHHGSMGYWGVLALNEPAGSYAPRKRMYALAQIARFVRPGARRIDVGATPTGIRAQAFVNADESITIVGINQVTSTVTLQGALQNLGTTALPTVLRLFLTSAARNMERMSDVSVTSGRFSAAIPADTIFTLTSMP